MSNTGPECLDADPSDRSVVSDVLVREDRDEEEDEEEGGEENDDGEEDDGYSE